MGLLIVISRVELSHHNPQLCEGWSLQDFLRNKWKLFQHPVFTNKQKYIYLTEITFEGKKIGFCKCSFRPMWYVTALNTTAIVHLLPAHDTRRSTCSILFVFTPSTDRTNNIMANVPGKSKEDIHYTVYSGRGREQLHLVLIRWGWILPGVVAPTALSSLSLYQNPQHSSPANTGRKTSCLSSLIVFFSVWPYA